MIDKKVLNELAKSAGVDGSYNDNVIWLQPPFYDPTKRNAVWEETPNTVPKDDPKVANFFKPIPDGFSIRYDSDGWPIVGEIPHKEVTTLHLEKLRTKTSLKNAEEFLGKTNNLVAVDIFETLDENEKKVLLAARKEKLEVIKAGGKTPVGLTRNQPEIDRTELLTLLGKFSIDTNRVTTLMADKELSSNFIATLCKF